MLNPFASLSLFCASQKTPVQKLFETYYKKHGNIHLLIAMLLLRIDSKIIIYGGVIRDTLTFGKQKTHDVDIFMEPSRNIFHIDGNGKFIKDQIFSDISEHLAKFGITIKSYYIKADMPTYKSAKESYAEEDMLEPDSIAFPLTSEIILAQIENPDLIGDIHIKYVMKIQINDQEYDLVLDCSVLPNLDKIKIFPPTIQDLLCLKKSPELDVILSPESLESKDSEQIIDKLLQYMESNIEVFDSAIPISQIKDSLLTGEIEPYNLETKERIERLKKLLDRGWKLKSNDEMILKKYSPQQIASICNILNSQLE